MPGAVSSYRLRRAVAGVGTPALRPDDIARLYHLDRFHARGIYGQGQRIGFVEFALPSSRDDALFWSKYSLRPELNTPARAVLLPRSRSSPAALGETDLDLQYAGALAPGAQLKAYVIDGGAPLASFPPLLWGALRAAAADGIRVVSISLGAGDADIGGCGPITDPISGTGWPDARTFCSELDAWIRAQGMLCFVSAGDSGAYAAFPADSRVQASWPATQAAVIAVGGTQLAVPRDAASGEQAWGGQTLDPSAPGYDASNTLPLASGGGGASAFLPAPDCQLPLGVTFRMTPDVAAFAGPLVVVDRGTQIPVWGTSASAPIVAAIATLYGQATGRILDHTALYAGARDVTTGNNYNDSLLRAGLGAFAVAGPGFDECTGMGVPDAASLPGC